MSNQENIKRLVDNILSDLATVKQLSANSCGQLEDLAIVSDLASSALCELNIFTDHIHTADESAKVKPLHDRVHVLTVQLRVLRNTLEMMENSAESALDDVRRFSACVEEVSPEDDEL